MRSEKGAQTRLGSNAAAGGPRGAEPAAVATGTNILDASLSGDGRTVTLTISPLSGAIIYRVIVGNLVGLQGEQLPPGSSGEFSLTPRVSDGLIALYGLEEGNGTTIRSWGSIVHRFRGNSRKANSLAMPRARSLGL